MKIPILGILAGLCSIASANFDYNDFSDVSTLQMNGVASQAGSTLRLTPLGGGQAGSAWHTTQQNVAGGFSTTFTYRGFEGSGADGVAFGVQSNGTTELGSGGYDNGMDDILGCVGVSFRSFWNEIGFFANNAEIQTISFSGLHRETPWSVQIDYDGTTKDWNIFLDSSLVMTQNFDVTSVVGSTAYAGLASGTGAADDNNDVYEWHYTETVPEPATLSALSLAGLGLLKKKQRQA